MHTPPDSTSTGSLIPLHAVSFTESGEEMIVKRKPGRPRRVTPRPTASEAEYTASVNRARSDFIAVDAVVRSTERTEQGSGELLRAIVIALAHETASIAWEVRCGRAAGTTTAQLSSRRVDGLCKIASILLMQHRLGILPDVDTDHPCVQRLLLLFVEEVASVVRSTMSPDFATEFVDRVRAALHASTTPR